jgi:membrane protease subunit (stomatin/prohibitin family)
MSLFGWMKSQLIDIVEWNQESGSDTMAWRFPRADNEIKYGAKLIVREGQKALFVNMGQLADVFDPGMYTLETKNLPVLSSLLGWKYGFSSPFKCEVYFIATRRFLDLKWGTSNPITMRDREFGMIRVRAYGSYAIQITKPAVFLREILATDPNFQVFQTSGQLRNIIVTRFSDALASSGLPVLDMAANLNQLSEFSQQKLTADFDTMGFSVPIFLVENISLPENVEKMLDKRTSMSLIGNMDQFMKFQAATALETAAGNPGGGGEGMGMGMGLGAGMAMANTMMGAMGAGGLGQGGAAGAAYGGVATAPPPLPGAAAFYVAIGGQQRGPLDANNLQSLAADGTLTRDTLVWKQGMPSWAKAGEVGDLAPLFEQGPPPLPPM